MPCTALHTSRLQVERAAVIQSARIAKAVRSLRGGRDLTPGMAVHAAAPYMEAGKAAEVGEGGTRTEGAKKGRTKAGAKKQKATQPSAKRVKTAYFLFLDEFRVSHEGLKFREMGKAAGDAWRGMSEQEKAPYVAQHEALKAGANPSSSGQEPSKVQAMSDSDRGEGMSSDDEDDAGDSTFMGHGMSTGGTHQAAVSKVAEITADEAHPSVKRRKRKAPAASSTRAGGSALGGMGCDDWRTGSHLGSKKRLARSRVVIESDESE